MTRETPPRLAEWLLGLVLRTPDREYILGDLAERYRRGREKGRSAWPWYWGGSSSAPCRP